MEPQGNGIITSNLFSFHRRILISMRIEIAEHRQVIEHFDLAQ